MASSSSQLVIGYLSAFGHMLAGTASASCTQALQGAVPDFQLAVARCLIQTVIYVIGGTIVGSDFKFTRETLPGLLYFGFLFLVYNVGFYGATTYLPLTEVYGVLVIASIVTAFLYSRFFFYISIAKSKIISLIVCVVGIILAVQPSWLFNQSARTFKVMSSAFVNISYVTHSRNMSCHDETEFRKGNVLLGYILSVIGGAAVGLMFDVSGIILKDVKPIVKVMYSAVFCMIGSVAFMFYLEEPVLVINLTQCMLVLGHGVLSALAGILFTQSMQNIPGPTLSAVYSLEMVIMIISQYTIMHSILPGNYNLIEVLGCMIIIFGGSIPPLMDILVDRAKSNEVP